MIPPPPWLAEFHRQWLRARGARPLPATSPFSRSWDDLLDASNLHSAELRHHAAREALQLASSGLLSLTRGRHQLSIIRIRLPITSEPWLRGLFNSQAPADALSASLDIVASFQSTPHPLFPDEWPHWCASLATAFSAGRPLRPCHWKNPDTLRAFLSLFFDLTSTPWPPATLVRDADITLGRPTKTIERHHRALAAALSSLTGKPTPLESLGLISSNSRLLFDGPLTLTFPDGARIHSDALRHGITITAADLARASSITTSASRIISVENHKTSFLHLAARNAPRDSLIIATSFPTKAVRLLLSSLPPSLPHWHFGDTDPAGFLILRQLRSLSPRHVAPWLMDWIDNPQSPPLSAWDRRTLDDLLASPLMLDCHPDLLRIRAANRKGAFEQEARSPLPPFPSLSSITPVSPQS